MIDITKSYLDLDAMDKLRFRDELLKHYLPFWSVDMLYLQLMADRDQYVEGQKYEIAQAYQDLIDDLKLLDNLDQ